MSSFEVPTVTRVTPALPRPPWWLVLLHGIASLVIGVLLLTETGMTILGLVIFFIRRQLRREGEERAKRYGRKKK